MKTTTLPLLIVLFAACASPTAVIDKNSFQCESGDDLGIAAGFSPGNQGTEMTDREFLVEVSNNSDHDVTVTLIRIQPSDRNSRSLAPAYQKTDVTIRAAEDHLFHLKVPPTLGPRASRGPTSPLSGVLDLYVMVELSNGDVYRCPFRVQVQ